MQQETDVVTRWRTNNRRYLAGEHHSARDGDQCGGARGIPHRCPADDHGQGHPSTRPTSGGHLDELNQDFKEVPNPKILGYVYPHYSATGMPVPGYFTSFRLYKVNHNALMGEGAIGELP
ncbi:hypothetical protein [Cardiobacterium valvarum]|uniref:Conjugative transfer region lipoprotein family n=1 Tax=Cardiobacterium valvarum F0432 TaxID=797473 RepID=G9ZJA4_9GAMM|nr:hypothetical protein [Cardiobacterium valvarum]EHM50245.1 conjugative transfer region lipoprotein family [Cardiobacterium valvarum F0432]